MAHYTLRSGLQEITVTPRCAVCLCLVSPKKDYPVCADHSSIYALHTRRFYQAVRQYGYDKRLTLDSGMQALQDLLLDHPKFRAQFGVKSTLC